MAHYDEQREADQKKATQSLNPLDQQVGGDHYKHFKKQPIELIKELSDLGTPYCWLTALKYLCRYPHKGKPVEDLEKAKHYLALDNTHRIYNSDLAYKTRVVVQDFVTKNEIVGSQRSLLSNFAYFVGDTTQRPALNWVINEEIRFLWHGRQVGVNNQSTSAGLGSAGNPDDFNSDDFNSYGAEVSGGFEDGSEETIVSMEIKVRGGAHKALHDFARTSVMEFGRVFQDLLLNPVEDVLNKTKEERN